MQFRQQCPENIFHACGDVPSHCVTQMHIVKNFLADSLGGVRVPVMLGVWGPKGCGKTFMTELAFKKLGGRSLHTRLHSPDLETVSEVMCSPYGSSGGSNSSSSSIRTARLPSKTSVTTAEELR